MSSMTESPPPPPPLAQNTSMSANQSMPPLAQQEQGGATTTTTAPQEATKPTAAIVIISESDNENENDDSSSHISMTQTSDSSPSSSPAPHDEQAPSPSSCTSQSHHEHGVTISRINNHKTEPSACFECRRVHKKCDKQRPCSRCIKQGCSCVDMPVSKRGRPRKKLTCMPGLSLDGTCQLQQQQQGTPLMSIGNTHEQQQQPLLYKSRRNQFSTTAAHVSTSTSHNSSSTTISSSSNAVRSNNNNNHGNCSHHFNSYDSHSCQSSSQQHYQHNNSTTVNHRANHQVNYSQGESSSSYAPHGQQYQPTAHYVSHNNSDYQAQAQPQQQVYNNGSPFKASPINQPFIGNNSQSFVPSPMAIRKRKMEGEFFNEQHSPSKRMKEEHHVRTTWNQDAHNNYGSMNNQQPPSYQLYQQQQSQTNSQKQSASFAHPASSYFKPVVSTVSGYPQEQQQQQQQPQSQSQSHSSYNYHQQSYHHGTHRLTHDSPSMERKQSPHFPQHSSPVLSPSMPHSYSHYQSSSQGSNSNSNINSNTRVRYQSQNVDGFRVPYGSSNNNTSSYSNGQFHSQIESSPVSERSSSTFFSTGAPASPYTPHPNSLQRPVVYEYQTQHQTKTSYPQIKNEGVRYPSSSNGPSPVTQPMTNSYPQHYVQETPVSQSIRETNSYVHPSSSQSQFKEFGSSPSTFSYPMASPKLHGVKSEPVWTLSPYPSDNCLPKVEQQTVLPPVSSLLAYHK